MSQMSGAFINQYSIYLMKLLLLFSLLSVSVVFHLLLLFVCCQICTQLISHQKWSLLMRRKGEENLLLICFVLIALYMIYMLLDFFHTHNKRQCTWRANLAFARSKRQRGRERERESGKGRQVTLRDAT